MGVALPLILAAASVGAGAGADPPSVQYQLAPQAGVVSFGRMRVGAKVRTYRLFVPRVRARRAPLVVALHGGGSRETGQRFAEVLKFDAEAAVRGFVVVYPDALGGRFNAGGCCNRGVTDVRFVDRLLARVADRHRIDRRRVFATGFSNGGFLAYTLACRRAATFAAVAGVATTEVARRCRPARPVSILHFHARNDSRLAYGRGRRFSENVTTPSIPGLIRAWRRRDRCGPARTLRLSANLEQQRALCAQRTEVRLLTSSTAGHSWPGADPPYGAHEAFSLTATIGAFFAARRPRG